ncbi:DUF6503 family protein [Hymenobacter psychrophilus]|uniref:Outer membrane lipoprotein-sorting protein n=1 Tax=Hymenobacter psychrophilus TaxID=651662 RepID=A0A1H3ESQ4_9BACT|nr:DUF6503 family protein [Hymenobacter psychrophilus]SDX81118.1 hypothetical protein SAMN04488069_103265 [Hymenobacter psychrophilus]
MKNSFYFSLAALLVVSCTSNPEQQAGVPAATATVAAASRELPELLQQALTAHGGLAAWQQFGTMEYRLKTTLGALRDEKHLIDLRTRQVRIEAPDYQIGMDGQQVWVSPSKAAFGEMSPRFYHNLFFYFFSIPFVLADEGTVYEDLGTRTIAGKDYRALKVSYETGRGDSSGDEYIAHFDPQTHRLELLLYTVTYFEPGKEASYNALLYSDWQEVNGLLLPQKMEGHKFANNEIGDLRYQADFSNVRLDRAPPAASRFAMPQGAIIDSVAK